MENVIEEVMKVQDRMSHHVLAIEYLQCNTKDMGLEGNLSQIVESMKHTEMIVQNIIAGNPPDF